MAAMRNGANICAPGHTNRPGRGTGSSRIAMQPQQLPMPAGSYQPPRQTRMPYRHDPNHVPVSVASVDIPEVPWVEDDDFIDDAALDLLHIPASTSLHREPDPKEDPTSSQWEPQRSVAARAAMRQGSAAHWQPPRTATYWQPPRLIVGPAASRAQSAHGPSLFAAASVGGTRAARVLATSGAQPANAPHHFVAAPSVGVIQAAQVSAGFQAPVRAASNRPSADVNHGAQSTDRRRARTIHPNPSGNRPPARLRNSGFGGEQDASDDDDAFAKPPPRISDRH